MGLSAGAPRFDPHKPLTEPTLPYIHSGVRVTGEAVAGGQGGAASPQPTECSPGTLGSSPTSLSEATVGWL